MDSEKVTYIGQVDHRNKMLTFGIKAKDRPQHMYIIGKTGMGKSTLLENLAVQDIQNGEGVCFMDPHGGTAEKLLDFIPEERKKDVIYFAPFDADHPIALNVLEKVEPSKRHLVANGLMAAFKKLFKDQFSARMEYILNNIVLALLENDGQTLLGVNRMLTDKDYRNFIVGNVTDPSVKAFWTEEYAKYTDKFAADAAPAIQNKVGQFVSNPLIRNIIGQAHTSFDIREVMDKKKILIINLSKGKVGEGNANLLGSLLITKIYLAAMSRADAGPYKLAELPPFYFYVDEFQNFANEAFASILSEARKYKLALTVAHQYVEQMTDEVKAAVFGNVGTMIAFRVGATDAEIFEKEFAPRFTADDIVNLSAYQIYLRLMIDGVGSSPFSAKALPPIQKPETSFAEDVIKHSRTMYSKPKNLVEDEVREWYKPIAKPVSPKSDYVAPANTYLPAQAGEKREGHSPNYLGKKPFVPAHAGVKKDYSVSAQEKFVRVEKNKDVAPVYEKINRHVEALPTHEEKKPGLVARAPEAAIEKDTVFIEAKEKSSEPTQVDVKQHEVREHAKKFISKKDAFVKPKLEHMEKTMSLKESIEKAMREKNEAESLKSKVESKDSININPSAQVHSDETREVDEKTLRSLIEE